MRLIMEEEESHHKKRRRLKSLDVLEEKGIDIDKKVTPDEARLIVYKLAVQLWGKDQTQIKKKLTMVSQKAMKIFEVDDVGSGERKRMLTAFGDEQELQEKAGETSESSRRETRHGSVPDKKQSIKKTKKSKVKPNRFRFRSPSEENLEPPPVPPEELRAAIEKRCGEFSGLTFLMQKVLTVTDIKRDQSRLLMPLRQVKAEFLNEAERQVVGRTMKITVILVEPTMKVTEIGLNRWEMKKKENNSKSSFNYALMTTWNDVKDENGLQVNDVVRVWAFRAAHLELGIALSITKFP